jgi:Bacterial extracellular solute-binding proteins, family 3
MLTPSRSFLNDPGGLNVAFRKLGAVLVASALFAALAACGDDDSAETSETTEAGAGSTNFTPVTDDTLTVVTSLPAPGFWEGDDPNNITGGYEYEIAKALQERLNLGKLKIVNVSFDQLVAGQVGDFDVALSQVTITDERKQVVDFTEPYFESDQGVLVMTGTKVDTVEEAKALQWGVQSGTTGADYLANTLKPDSEPQVFQDLAAGFAALQAGHRAVADERVGRYRGGRSPVQDGRGVRRHPAQGFHQRRRHQLDPDRAEGRRLAVRLRQAMAGWRPERRSRSHAVVGARRSPVDESGRRGATMTSARIH